MSSKRTVALAAVLLGLVGWFVAKPALMAESPPAALPGSPDTLPLPGVNSVTGLAVHRDASGQWIASFDYYYTGEPRPVQVLLGATGGAKDWGDGSAPQLHGSDGIAKRGKHHVEAPLQRPLVSDAMRTERVVASLLFGKTIAMQRIDHAISWPDLMTYEFERRVAADPARAFDDAVLLIDRGTGESLDQAKRLLERLLARDSKFERGYIELARVAMKTNWGPEGLHQAENFLSSALQIDPASVNAKILLGYVYAHQKRYAQAQALFAESAPSDPPNMWLWSNWGELLAMQGKIGPAIEKYRVGLDKPRTTPANDRARLDAYAHLLPLLEDRKDTSGTEALLRKRVEEFGPTTCYGVELAWFLVRQRGDASAARDAARQALDGGCAATNARDALGVANYLAWAGSTQEQRAELLNQARIYLPVSPRALYLLATSDRTMPALRKLRADGESIDQHDNSRMTALTLALQARDMPAARRLISAGASPKALVGFDEMPVALMPVITGDVDGIRLMQQSGIDYSKLRFRGQTALDHARQLGDRRLLDALDPSAHRL